MPISFFQSLDLNQSLNLDQVYLDKDFGRMFHNKLIFSLGCLENNFDYAGYDLQRLSAKTALACQDFCKKNEKCDFFSWIQSNKACYLKHSKKNRKVRTGIISGPKTCEGKIIYVIFTLSYNLNNYCHSRSKIPASRLL